MIFASAIMIGCIGCYTLLKVQGLVVRLCFDELRHVNLFCNQFNSPLKLSKELNFSHIHFVGWLDIHEELIKYTS